MKKIFTLMLAVLVSFGLVLPAHATDQANVAKIGDTEYPTLGAAIEAVQSGETIVLLKDVDSAGISVKSGKEFTVDFAGHTYTLTDKGAGSTGTETNGFQLLKDSTITFKNGTINVKENQSSIKLMIQNYANLTLEDMTIDPSNKVGFGTASNEDYALSINNGNVTLKGNTTFKASNPDVIAFDICKMGNYPGVAVKFAEDYTGVIEGTILYDSTNSSTHTLEIKGNGTIGNISYSENNGENAKNAISIHSGSFKSLDALDYVKEGAKVNLQLTKDETKSITIPEKVEVTLDLNGHTLTNEENQHTITNLGKLTVVGEGKVDNVSNNRGALVSTGENASVVIEGGEFTRSKEASEPRNSWYVISNGKGSQMTINNANVHSTSTESSLIDNAGSLTIKGGQFKNEFITVKVEDYSKLEITGGTITSTTQAIQSYGETKVTGGQLNGRVSVLRYKEAPTSLNITGGNVNGDVVLWDYFTEASGSSSVEINGGNFNGNVVMWNKDKEPIDSAKNANIDVKAGTFNTDVEKYVSSAYVKVDGVYYAGTQDDLQDVVNDAKENVTILKGITSLNVPSNVVVVNDSDKEVIVNDNKLAPDTVLEPGLEMNMVPVISAADVTLVVGDEFDPMAKVKATDAEDGDLTAKIKVIKNTVDTTKAGEYEVTYQVEDSEKALSTKTIKVKVVEKVVETPEEPQPQNPQPENPDNVQTSDAYNMTGYIAMAGISGLLLVGAIVLKKKKFN